MTKHAGTSDSSFIAPEVADAEADQPNADTEEPFTGTHKNLVFVEIMKKVKVFVDLIRESLEQTAREYDNQWNESQSLTRCRR